MTFRLANLEGVAALVDAQGGLHPLDTDPLTALADTDRLHGRSGELDPASPADTCAAAESAGRLGAPVPNPRSVFAVGLNYRSHAAESGLELPQSPLVFTKYPSCLVGPRDDVALNASAADYEVELVVVIGTGGRDIVETDAWSHVAGLTIGQDISDRALQFAAKPPHFDLGKSRDTYGPMGPVLVSTDSFADPDDIELSCWVNGDRRQHDRTSNLIFGVPQLISYLSSILTLSTGDVIFTGTPEGVGAASRQFLAPGDVVTSTIEGIGTMVNRCVER
jgi:2-keto-4-pentenoate hydratase/2-oxohepta-3-ene-1,7-dioic acid hydratase in catechol pathway